MKPLAVFVIFAVLAYASADTINGPTIYDGPTYELKPIEEPANDGNEDATNSPVRQARVTCDLLSWQSQWLSINHSACAAKCLAQRRRGGRCRDGICICR
ncbi:defensin-2-like [Pseudomyrmex gracilis]|uniref:defensin-2-like n=1 Tax=Pseudomyrmex gracilis TaxID=219809 RepID=UPI00099497C7|nr:defensin-2-like [Pseudomyrmex gracilis]XP_020279145.1 defensin-2-like [Pseudomyrmex gracilis]